MASKRHERGRNADRPSDIPKSGWRDILVRVKKEAADDHLSIVAAGAAFYLLLAAFPALAAAVSMWGAFADPASLERQLATIAQVAPEQAYQVIENQLRSVASASGSALSLAAIGTLLVTLWSAGKGVAGLIEGLNITYDEHESRGFIRRNLLIIGLTLGGIVFGLVALALVAAIPAIVNLLALPATISWVLLAARWPLLAILLMIALSVLYWAGPDRTRPTFRWVSWGAALATVLWIAASAGFSFYVSNFGNYNETYGALGAVAVLMLWLFISAYVILLGSEVNAEIEHQTARDTTATRERPLGERGAYVADTVGEAAGEGERTPRRRRDDLPDTGESRYGPH